MFIFCACGKQLDSRFESLGAKRFADRVDVHKEDLPAIDKWLSGVTTALQALQLQTFQDTGGVHEPLLGAVQLVILPAQKPGKLIKAFSMFLSQHVPVRLLTWRSCLFTSPTLCLHSLFIAY